jgi:hypothetical protein
MSTYVTKFARENGIKKVDAGRSLQLEVIGKDCNKRGAKDPQNCAFACAAKRELGAERAFFFRSTAWLLKGGKLVRYTLPQSVQKEIVSFDRTGAMAPGVYHLSRPTKTQTMAAITERAKKRPGRHEPGKTKIKRKMFHQTQGIRTLKYIGE